MPSANYAIHSTHLLSEGHRRQTRPLAGSAGILTALRQNGKNAPRFILLQAENYYANRQYERALSAADQSMEWARKIGFHDGDFLTCALATRAACEWQLGRTIEGLRTIMAATRQTFGCESPAIQWVTLALAARYCLRLGSGDMSGLFARQAWNAFQLRLAGSPLECEDCTRYLYHVAECLVFERSPRPDVRVAVTDILAYMEEHLPRAESAPRRVLVEYQAARAELRLSRAQMALDRLAKLEPAAGEYSLWEITHAVAQARLDLQRDRPAHAMQSADQARCEASLQGLRDMENEALEVWYQAYQRSRARHRSDRRALAAFGGGDPKPLVPLSLVPTH